jgi:hypothetical protein
LSSLVLAVLLPVLSGRHRFEVADNVVPLGVVAMMYVSSFDCLSRPCGN